MNNRTILFVDACVREQSRTRRLASYVLEQLEGQVTELRLEREPMAPLDGALLERRNKAAQEGRFSDELFRYAHLFADADEIVIAAPYWDLSFPALLKTFLEQVCVVGVTFRYDETGMPEGLCKARRLIYVTTVGGVGLPEEFGYGYVSGLARQYFGIPETRCIKAEGLDIIGADVPELLKQAEKEAENL